MNKYHFKRLNREKGISTLVIVVLLLFVATMVTLYTANTSVREQQVSANQYRADQALSAANAGLDFAYAYYQKNPGADANMDGVVDTLVVPTGLLAGENLQVSAVVTYTDGDPSVDRDGDGNFTNDALDRPHTITSQGFSDDSSATRTISIEVDVFSVTPPSSFPGFPLVAKSIAASGGNFSIINRFSNATIWTGGDATTLGSAETYIRDPLDPPQTRAEYIDISGSPDPDLVLHASYSQGGLNSDVLESDDNLANMTPDEFFQNFLIEDRATLKAFAGGIGQVYDAATTSWSDLIADGVKGLVWIDGDWSESGSLSTLGTEQNPVTLIVDGDFTTTGTGPGGIDVIGLIYVAGDWDSGGNFEVQGGIIVEGEVDNSGTPTIVFDNGLFDGSLGAPPGGITATLAGTWRDW